MNYLQNELTVKTDHMKAVANYLRRQIIVPAPNSVGAKSVRRQIELAPNHVGAKSCWRQIMLAPKRRRQIGGAKTMAPNRRRQKIGDPH